VVGGFMVALTLFFLIVVFLIVVYVVHDFGYKRGLHDVSETSETSASSLDDMLEGLNEDEKVELLKDFEEEREFQRKVKRSMDIRRIAKDLEKDNEQKN